jgi:hypothetical protein
MVSGRVSWLLAGALLVVAGAWWLLREKEASDAARENARLASDDGVALSEASDTRAPSGRVELPQLTATQAERTRPDASGSSTAEAAAPDQRPSETFISGWLVTQRGLLLADHEIELLGRNSKGKFGWASEGKTATSSSGRFYFPHVSPGPKRLQITGPGAGDLRQFRRSWRRHDRDEPPDEIVTLADEGEVSLLVSATGAADVTVVSHGHPEFWVVGHLGELPVDPAAARGEHEVWVGGAHVTDAAGNRGSSDLAIEPLGAGPLLATTEVLYDKSGVGSGLVLAPAWNPDSTLLVVDFSWCRTITQPFTPPEPGGLVDVGELSTEATGLIYAHAVFGAAHQDVLRPALVCWFRGGGHPDEKAEARWDSDRNAFVITTDRSAGTWEITATARDYADGHLSGELRPFLDIEVDVELTPLPR